MGKKRFVNTRETEGEELTMSQEAIANGKKLASQVRKVLESETDKENLDLLEYDIVSIFFHQINSKRVNNIRELIHLLVCNRLRHDGHAKRCFPLGKSL